MKKIYSFMLVAFLLLGSQGVNADTYQHWVTWFNTNGSKTTHNLNQSEMAEMTTNLYHGDVAPYKKYKLSSGTVYMIPQPSLYLDYIERCVRTSRPTATTAQKVIDAIAESDKIQWGNDISARVRNYYFSSANKRVQFNDNYSGSSLGIWVLVIDGTPTIKCDCGNPLEGIGLDFFEKKEEISKPPAPSQTTTTESQYQIYKKTEKDTAVTNLGNLNPISNSSKKEIKVGKIALRIGEGGLIITALYLILKSLGLFPSNHGEPGGANTTVIPDPVVSTPTGGVPGGSPTTK